AVNVNWLPVAEADLPEHAAMIRGDILAMGYDIGRARPLFDQDRERFRQFLNAQASIRGLPHALMVRGDLSIIERADLKTGGDFVAPSSGALKEVGESEPQIALLAEAKPVAAVLRLRGSA